MRRDRTCLHVLMVVTCLSFAQGTWSEEKDAPREPERRGNIRASDVVGTWKLVSIEDRRPNGEIAYWMGRNPVGLIIYDAKGNMSVQIMRDPRPMWSFMRDPRSTWPSAYAQISRDEIKTVYEGYYAYFGTYDVDEREATVTHHVKGSVRPSEVGTDYTRSVQLTGDRLTLSLTPTVDGEKRLRILIWERIR